MKIKHLKALLFLLTFTISTWNGQSQEVETSFETPPNFVIIFTDDLGYGDLSSFGHPTIVTPNLDKMASEGQKWTNFYVAASVCTPSRAAILTGRLPVRSGMASSVMRVLHPFSSNGLPQKEITLAEQLKKANYATAAIGKWHLGHKEQYLPVNQGFDYYFGIPYSNDMDVILDMEEIGGYWKLWESEERKKMETFNVPIIRNTEVVERPADQRTITKRYTDEAIQFIKDKKKDPFFVYLAYNLPHVPLFVSEEFQGTSKGGLYGDVVEEIDYNVGRLIDALKEEGVAENTIVIFTSDNGPWLEMKEEGGTAGLLRGGKGSTWEGGMREPTIFWSPGNIASGVITDNGTTMDLFTTFSNLAGVALPQDRPIDGNDLGPVLFGRGNSPTEVVYFYRGDELYAIRVGAFKAHYITQGAYEENREEHNPPLLFNLNIDPGERFNVAEEHPDIIAKINEVVKEHNSKMVKGEDQLKDLDR